MRGKKRLINCIIALCVVIVGGAGYLIVRNLTMYQKAENVYEEIAAETGVTEAQTEPVASEDEDVPTFDEWLELTGQSLETEASEETQNTPEPTDSQLSADNEGESGGTESTETPSGETDDSTEDIEGLTEEEAQEEIQEAQLRAEDESDADEQYAQIMNQMREDADLDSLERETLLRQAYRLWLKMSGYLQNAVYQSARLMNFDALKAQNPDVKAWLTNPGTVINYPVVQGTDNKYYLEHLFDGSSNKTGTLFVDVDNEGDFSDRNTIIHGHHMRNDSMFGTLANYMEQEYYDEHPTMILYTEDATYLVELFAGYSVQIKGKGEYAPYQMAFATDEEFLTWVEEAKAQSTFESDVELEAGDRVLTLSTCTYEVYNARYVLHGKLTMIASSEEEQASDARV